MIVKDMKAAKVPEDNIKGLQAFMGGFVNGMSPEQKLFEAQAHAFMAALTAIYASRSIGVDSFIGSLRPEDTFPEDVTPDSGVLSDN